MSRGSPPIRDSDCAPAAPAGKPAPTPARSPGCSGAAGAPDLLIVGGGPAGLAVAIRARQAGLAATVLDRSSPPIDKPCGEGLMPDGLALLAEMGVVLPPGESAPFRGIRYLDGGAVADGEFPRGAGPIVGRGVRRTVLHQALVRRAEALGAELRWGERATGIVLPGGDAGGRLGEDGSRGAVDAERRPADELERGEDRELGGSKDCELGRGEATEDRAGMCGEPQRGSDDEDWPGVVTEAGVLRGRFLIGADGLLSRVRRWAGLEGAAAAPGDRRARFGVRRHFRLPPWGDRVEVHWADRCEAYVTPVGPELVGVAMLWSGGPSSFDELLGRFPALRRRLDGAPAASRDQGCGPLAQRPRRVTRGRIALVGDASGYLDAITGEGLSLAFHQAAALVEAVIQVPGDSGWGAAPTAGSAGRAAWTAGAAGGAAGTAGSAGGAAGTAGSAGGAAGTAGAAGGAAWTAGSAGRAPGTAGSAGRAAGTAGRLARVEGASLASYERAHRRLRRLPEALIRLLLAVERRPALRRRMVRALAADPELFSRILGVHARALPVSAVGVSGALRLAWRLAAA